MGSYKNPHSPSYHDRSGNLPFERIEHFRINRRSKLGGGLIFPRPEHNAPHFSSFKDCVEWAVRNKISLKGADLTDPYDGYNMQGGAINLSGGKYDGGDFRDVMMEDVNWSNSSLVSANFSGSHTIEEIKNSGYSLYTTEARNSNFSGCNLTKTKYDNAILEYSKFDTLFELENKREICCLMDGTSFKGAQIEACKFFRIRIISDTLFDGVAAFGATFREIDMRNAKDFPLQSGARFFDCQLPPHLYAEQRTREAQYTHLRV